MSNDIEPAPVHWLPRTALALFAAGVMLIGIAFAHAEGASDWLRAGGLLWIAAYFVVLFDNFSRKLPVRVRGGLVRREDGLLKYAGPYLCLAVMGLGTLIVAVFA